MKYYYYFTLFLLLTLTVSCKKEGGAAARLPEDNGCVERKVIVVTDYSVDPLDTAVINDLFLTNGIDRSNFRYTGYSDDSLQTQFPPYAKVDYKTVRIDQFTNGLPILYGGELVFSFKNGIFDQQFYSPSQGTSLDTIPQLTAGQVRKLFIDDLKKREYNGDQYKDSCVTAEFGYYDINAGMANAQEKLVKAWRLTPKSIYFPSVWPQAFYQDKDGRLLSYDDGIRLFLQ